MLSRFSFMLLLVKIVDPLAHLSNFDDIDKIIEQNKKCIEDVKQSSDLVEKRFTTSQLAFLCKNRQKWTSEAENRLKKMADVNTVSLTSDQQSWLNKIYSCYNLESCVCQNAQCSLVNDLSKGDGHPSVSGSRHKRQLPERVLRPALRKEYRMLTDYEREKFHNAMNRLKNDIIDNVGKYDLLSIYHTPEHSPGAHWGPAFLPFHRELLKQLEASLRFYDNSVALPYWDSTLDEGLPDPRNSILWTDAFLGNGDGYVESGPFRRWNTTKKIQDEQRLFRTVGQAPFGGLYRNDDVAAILAKTKFEQLTACVDPFFELLHGTVHMWVGGYMLDIPISPNDPSFYLHHAFVDYLWEQFRLQKQDRIIRQTDYPSEDKCCNSNHYMGNFMLPFKLRNIDGLANTYTDNYYVYEPRPSCSEKRPNCNSPYLFCNTKKFRCVSKIVEGGNCTGFEDTDICFKSVCVNNICKAAGANQVTTTQSSKTTDSTVTTTTVTSTVTSTVISTTPGNEFKTDSVIDNSTARITWTADIIPVSITTSSLTDGHESKSEVTPLVPKLSINPGDRNICSCSCDSKEQFSFEMDEKFKHSTDVRSEFENRTNLGQSQNALDELAKQKDFSTNETNFEYVWFTVTVLKHNLDNMFKEQINATVVVKGLDYDDDFATNVSTRNGYPFYPGATLLRVKNRPEGRVTAQISAATHDHSTPCAAYCYQNSAVGYVKCSGKLEVDSKINFTSDSLVLFSNKTQALIKPWNGRSRKPDYLMFLCEENVALSKKITNDCIFVRLENFMLVGYSDLVDEGKSLDSCKNLCRESETSHNFKCLSLIYWTKRKSCVVTKESRFTQPALFGHFPNESAIYMDYVCEVDKILER